MELSVADRYTLLEILPKEGTYTTLKIIRQLREALSFTEEEIKKFKITEEVRDNGFFVNWDFTGPQTAEVKITERGHEIIVAKLKELDHREQLTERSMALYEKFITA